MQNNKVNQEDKEPKLLFKRFIDWLDRKEPGMSFMWALLLLQFIGFGLFIMIAKCSTTTIIIVSVSTVIGLIVLLALDKLVTKMFSRKKSQVIKLTNLGNDQNSKERLIDKSEIENLNNGVKTEDTNNINNIIENK